MPTLNDLNLSSTHLSNLSVSVGNELDGLIAEKVFPTLEVSKDRGYYYTWSKDALRVDNSIRATKARAVRVDYGLSSTSYGPLVAHALEHWIDDQELNQATEGIDLVANATRFLTEKMMVDKEANLYTLLNSTSNCPYYTTLSGTSQWSDHTNSNPFTDIQTGVSSVMLYSGKRPNTLVMGQAVWDQLVNHPDLVERIKYTYGNTANKMSITTQELGNILGMNVIVGSGIKESADEGATSSLAYIWGKMAWVMYVAPTPGLMTATAGYHLQLGQARKVDTYRDEAHYSTVVRISDKFEAKIVSTGAIYFVQNAVA